VHRLGVGLGEDRADGGGDHLGVALRHAGEHVAHEVHPAPSSTAAMAAFSPLWASEMTS